MSVTGAPEIEILGAAEHNLRDLSVSIPLHKFSIVTGPPGSGKRSLLFQTLAQEVARRFSLVTLQRAETAATRRVNVRAVRGASFVRACRGREEFSGTVGDYLRLTYRLADFIQEHGVHVCERCGGPLRLQTWEAQREQILAHSPEEQLAILVSVPIGEPRETIRHWVERGISWVLLRGERVRLDELHPAALEDETMLSLLVDAVRLGKGGGARIEEAVRRYGSQGFDIELREGEAPCYQISPYLHCDRCGNKQQEGRPALGGETVLSIGPKALGEVQRWRIDVSEIVTEIDWVLELCDLAALKHLRLNQHWDTLSRGEKLRIELVRCWEEQVAGATLLVEYPGEGLNHEERRRLAQVFRARASASGDTIVAIEQAPEFVSEAHTVIQLGPGSGRQGGSLVEVPAVPQAATVRLNGDRWEQIVGPEITFATFPRCAISCVTSGSSGALHRLRESLEKTLLNYPSGELRLISPSTGKVRPRSALDVGGVLGVRERMAEFYAQIPEAKMYGLTLRDFAPRKGGDIHPLASEVRFHGVALSEVSHFTLSELERLFRSVHRVVRPIRLACDCVLGYLEFGQPISSLSESERGRLNVSLGLGATNLGASVFVFDYLASELDDDGISSLFTALRQGVTKGATVILFESDEAAAALADRVFVV